MNNWKVEYPLDKKKIQEQLIEQTKNGLLYWSHCNIASPSFTLKLNQLEYITVYYRQITIYTSRDEIATKSDLSISTKLYDFLQTFYKDTLNPKPTHINWQVGAPPEGCNWAFVRVLNDCIMRYVTRHHNHEWTLVTSDRPLYIQGCHIQAHYPLDNIVKSGKEFCCE